IIGQLNSPIEQLIGFLQSWQNAKISLDRLNEFHKLEDEEPEDKTFEYELPPAFTMQVVGGNNISNALGIESELGIEGNSPPLEVPSGIKNLSQGTVLDIPSSSATAERNGESIIFSNVSFA